MGIFNGYLMVSDMDGTLINSKREITLENIEAINYFVEEGGIFTVATGRMVASAMEYIHLLKINAPCILHNGGIIFNSSEERILRKKLIENNRKEVVKNIKNENNHLGIEIFADEIVYIYNPCKFTERYERHNYNIIYDVDDSIFEKEWTKVLLLGEENEIDEIEKIYGSKYDNGYCCRSGKHFFDIVANGVTKGEGVNYIANMLGISKDKVITVGDSMNDIEMLKEYKYGFFINGGDKRLESIAKYKAPSCNENPIKYIVEFMKNEVIK